MKAKKIWLFSLGVLTLLTSGLKDLNTAQKVETTKKDIVGSILKLSNDSSHLSSLSNDPLFVFTKALEGYKAQFDQYLDVTALNVEDKREVNLPDFNPSYIPPSYADVMYDYQSQLENKMSLSQFEKYEALRQKSYEFDKYVTLNATKYVDLNVKTKYQHTAINDPLLPGGPKHDIPLLPPIGNGGMRPPIQTMSATVAVTAGLSGLAAILSSAGIVQSVISAFTGAVSTLTAAITSSWIPIIGLGIAIGLAIGALVALVAIIVTNWDAISRVIDKIKAWFLNEFSLFSSLINSYFADAEAKGKESTMVGRDVIGGKEIIWQSKLIRTTADIAALEAIKKLSKTVFIMRNVKKQFDSQDGKYYLSFWWFDGVVTEDFVTANNIYDRGISTYTWFQNRARRMMKEGTILLERLTYNEYRKPYKIGYHSFFQTEKVSINGFHHYHVFETTGDNGKLEFKKIRDSKGPISKAHSFFGFMFFRLSGIIEKYPKN